jgi:MFS family permease
MDQKTWERLRSRMLLVVVAWPWFGIVLGAMAAWHNGEHGSIIYVVLGFTVGICGAASDAAITYLQKNRSRLSNIHWLWVGACTTLLMAPLFTLVVRPDPYVWEASKADAIFAATYGVLPAFAISLLLSQISKMRSNPPLNRTRQKRRAG